MFKALRRLLSFDTPGPARAGRRRLVLDPADVATVYAIGDIHGCLDLLIEAEGKIAADAAGRPGKAVIVALGDLVDRGPSSYSVINRLMGAQPDGFERISLCGNHDDAFLDFVGQPADNFSWLDFGGEATLKAYGLGLTHILRERRAPKILAETVREVVPKAHVDFLRQMPVMITFGRFVFVHAGIQPGVPLDEQDDRDLMWIREPFLARGPELPVTVVHGHTPTAEPVFAEGRIGIDTGAYSSGRLTVLRVTQESAEVLA